ncbi:DNA mismatch repair endonuclease MutL [Glaciecola sp. 1036]|uniref:DNA mismatch repair endonuclease MutL n=1 Tax=Alteromonadaceae TaxID=72275 RepID=UPI003D0611B8
MTTEESRQIRILPQQLANQIAAGEVVERPASVVKELVENSLDAGASSIQIEIDMGGHKRICIRDDGKGIAKDQLSLALSRHATSKIYSLDDLDAIMSMGFRGEALASISSVSRCTLTSKTQHQEAAWQASAEGSDMVVDIIPAAHPKGTSVEVIDLFYNTPARRKFLRAPKTEFQHIEQIVKRIALAYPQISFELKHNGKRVYKFTGTDQQKRILQVCKNKFLDAMLPLDYAYEQIKISGWITPPGNGFDNNENQFLFINHRMMKDRLLMHALRQAYEGMLPDAKHPGFVIFLDIPPNELDVNVHPAKHEVRFRESRHVHDVFYSAINQRLISDSTESFDKESQPTDIHEPSHNYIRPLNTEVVSTTNPTRQSLGGGYSFNKPSASHIKKASQSYHQLMQVSSQDEQGNSEQFILIKDTLLISKNEQLWALKTDKIAHALLTKRLDTDASENGITMQPLLMPISVSDTGFAQFKQKLQDMGFNLHQHNQKLMLKQVPSFLRSLPWAQIFPAWVSFHPDSEAALLTGLAKAWCRSVVLDHTLVKSWIIELGDSFTSVLQLSGQQIQIESLLDD